MPKLIAKAAASNMSPDELSERLEYIGWPVRQFARRLDCSDIVVRKMLNGERIITHEVAAFVRAVDSVIRAFGTPSTDH
jgi:plasmid maintenance system antidote protein VapI